MPRSDPNSADYELPDWPKKCRHAYYILALLTGIFVISVILAPLLARVSDVAGSVLFVVGGISTIVLYIATQCVLVAAGRMSWLRLMLFPLPNVRDLPWHVAERYEEHGTWRLVGKLVGVAWIVVGVIVVIVAVVVGTQ